MQLSARARVDLESVVTSTLSKIQNTNRLINAFTKTVPKAELLCDAYACPQGPLLGLPVAIKDNIYVRNLPVTCASPMLKDLVAPWDASSVECLRKAGALVIGKTNMDEFGMGSHCTRSIFGSTLNPSILKDPLRLSAGGSSGGSAAAVAAGICPIALGSDTGGSIRLPASYCGVVGFKPSYGRISRFGLVSYASSLDTVGLLAESVPLIEAAFSVLRHSGGDRDMTSQQRATPTQIRPLSSLTVAVPRELLAGDLASEASENLDLVLKLLSNCGAKITQRSMPSLRFALATYYVIAMVEAASCLARYPSQFFPTPSPSSSKDGSLAFGPHVSNRIRLGRWISSRKNHQAIYKAALGYRDGVRADFSSVFKSADLILSPTSLSKAPLLSSVQDSPDSPLWREDGWERILSSDFSNAHLDELMTDLLTVPASLAGVPAISLPIHQHSTCGVQIMAPFFQDEELLLASRSLMALFGQRSI